MSDQFLRTRMLLGDAAISRLARARVAVFGLGGVGGHVAEALARGGVGGLDLVDNDVICPTNLNRQIFATQKTVGLAKTEAARARLLEINPDIVVTVHQLFYGPDTAAQFDFIRYDYVVDAIDTVTGKLELVERAHRAGTPIISCMGTGNKLDPGALEVADISKTSVCPLARIMRKELKKRGISHLKVVYSKELPLAPLAGEEEFERGVADEAAPHRRQVPGSTPFVPAVAGLLIAGAVVGDLIGPDIRPQAGD